jgi:hypothetical protein
MVDDIDSTANIPLRSAKDGHCRFVVYWLEMITFAKYHTFTLDACQQYWIMKPRFVPQLGKMWRLQQSGVACDTAEGACTALM